MNTTNDIITRRFVVQRGNRDIVYPFTTFSEIFVKKERPPIVDMLINYLREVFLNGVPKQTDDTKSISQMNELVLKGDWREYRDHEDICDLAKEADYQGRGHGMHATVQEYFLKNDKFTVATEIPVWDEEENTSGHIDLVRVLDADKIQVLDFKPKAYREKKALSQVFRYRKTLAKRTGIPLKNIEAAYFDDENACFLCS